MTEREAFEFYAAKAPVFQRCGRGDWLPRQLVDGVRHAFWAALLTVDRSDLDTAVDHARIGEGRAEFDAVCARIRERLWPEAKR